MINVPDEWKSLPARLSLLTRRDTILSQARR